MKKVTRSIDYKVAVAEIQTINGVQEVTIYVGMQEDAMKELIKKYGASSNPKILSSDVVFGKKLSIPLHDFVSAGLVYEEIRSKM